MTGEQYGDMVRRLEEAARSDPAAYKTRVGLLALLGYAYLLVLGVGLLAAGLVFGFLTIKWQLGWVVFSIPFLSAGVGWFVLRALWVRFEAPAGVALTRAQAPRLYSLAEEIARAVGAPPVHRVLATDQFNASVVQAPLLGPLGWQRNYLRVGLPLMQALSPAQFRAVLAHEMGHLSARHGRFARWIYRVRQTWLQLLARMEREQRVSKHLFTHFFNWYAPYFFAYTLVLARAHEYEADTASARFAGARTAAEALVAIEIKGAYLSAIYWPAVFAQADERPEPVPGGFAGMASALREPAQAEFAPEFFRQTLLVPTGPGDTHPSLADRLSALGFGMDASREREDLLSGLRFEGESAAEHFLGDAAARLSAHFDEVWRRTVGDQWRERHGYVEASERTAAALAEKARTSKLTDEESYRLGSLLAELGRTEEAIPHLERVPRHDANFAGASFILGQILLARGDESAVSHFEAAMDSNPDAVIPACVALRDHFTAAGRAEESGRYGRRLEEHLAGRGQTP